MPLIKKNPRESLKSPQDGPFPPIASRPGSPSSPPTPPSPSFMHHRGQRDSAASSVYLNNGLNYDAGDPIPRGYGADSRASSAYYSNPGQGGSSINLLQYPRPTYLHQNSSTSSLTSDFDGATIVPTPNAEKAFEKPWVEGELSSSKFNRLNGSTNSFFQKFEPESYHIETIDKNDDADLLKPWKRKLYRLSPVFTFLACASYFLYYAYRIHCTIVAQAAFGKVYVMAWLFIAAEGAVACMSRSHSR